MHFGPCQAQQYDRRPGESMSRWGQRHSVYNTIKYSKHVSLSWTWGIVWHLCYQKASWGQCFNKIECGTVVSTFSTSKADLTFVLFRCRHFDLWSKELEGGSVRPWAFEMMKPVHWVGLKHGGLMDHHLRLVFRQVPQNICLYFFGTKPDIWVHLTYRKVHSFTICAHPDRHWVITSFHLVLGKKVMERDDFWRSEYGYFINVKCFQHEVDCYKKTGIAVFRWLDSATVSQSISSRRNLFHSSNSSAEETTTLLPLKGSIAKP